MKSQRSAEGRNAGRRRNAMGPWTKIWSVGTVAVATMLASGSALADGSLTTLGVTPSGSGVVLEIGLTGTGGACGDFTLPDPPQIVISCAGLGKGTVEPVTRVGQGAVDRIEVVEAASTDGVTTQVTVFLTEMVRYERVAGAGSGLKLAIGDVAAQPKDAIGDALARPTAAAASGADLSLPSTRTGKLSSVDGDHAYGMGVQVQGVDFQQKLEAGISRLVITGSQRLSYSTSFPSPDRMVIEVPGATLGTGLERTQDTSQFASAVDAISAYRSRQSRGDVKISVKLRQAVTPKVTEQGNVLLIDFPIPPSIAGATYAAPQTTQTFEQADEPLESAAEERMESAYARETFIGIDGKAIDPAKGATHRQQCVLPGEDCVFLGEIEPTHRWSGFPINLNLVSANIHNVFRLISAVSKLNIVTSDDVDGNVTVQLNEVPWDQGLAAILQSKSLGAVQYGAVLRVAPLAVIRREREDAAAAMVAKSESQPLSVLTLPLNFADAEEVVAQVTNLLSRRGTVSFDSRTNSLVVRDVSTQLNQVRRLVKELDLQTPQVHIEARIVEATSTFSRSLGVQWGGNLNFGPGTQPTGLFFPNSLGVSGGNTAATVGAAGNTTGGRETAFTTVPNYVVDLPANSGASSLGLSLGSINGLVNLDLRLSAGEADGTGKIISSPSITTVTNATATIRDGARIPYETASLRGNNVAFAEAVLLLEVTPSITRDGTIFLDVSLTKNRPDFGAAVRGLPTIQIKEAMTRVMVPDGDTAVIGGVYSHEQSLSRTFVPGLGRIPVLGWLFKTTTKRDDRSELLVFITPSIVRNLQ